MNQSNQSLQVSKNNCFSEQNQPSQQHTDEPSQIAASSAYGPYDVEIFAIGAKDKIFSYSYAVREHAEQWAKDFDPDLCQELFLHSYICFYGSEFSRDRQEVLCRVVGATRGQYFVVHGGSDKVFETRLISPVLQSREQAEAWRNLSLPYYPDCQVFHYESEPHNNRPGFQNDYDLVTGNHITAFVVGHGDDGERRCLPINDRYFTTESQARRYQSEIFSEHPACQISQQNFHFEDISQRQKLLERLFGHFKVEHADSSVEV